MEGVDELMVDGGLDGLLDGEREGFIEGANDVVVCGVVEGVDEVKRVDAEEIRMRMYRNPK